MTQIGTKFAQAANPATLSVTTPTVALMMVAGPTLMSANFATRAGRRNVSRPPDQRSIKKPPVTASRVLPTAMMAAVSSVPAVVALAAKAPIRIAGQTRKPPSRTAASAKPVGGQIGLALGLMEASRKPNLASAK